MPFVWIVVSTALFLVFAGIGFLIYTKRTALDWRKPLLLLIVVIVGLVAAEVSAHMYFNYRLKAVGERTLDDTTGWRTRPDFQSTVTLPEFGEVTYSTDANGFRIAGDPNTDKIKVLVIGDSYTQALQVSDSDAYYSAIDESTEYELWAYGCGGFGNYQQYLVIDEWFDTIKPDIIVWQLCPNDFVNNDNQLESRSRLNNNNMWRPYLTEDGPIWRYPWPTNNPLYYIVGKSRLLRYFDTKLRLSTLGEDQSIEESLVPGTPEYASLSETSGRIFELARARVGTTRIVAFSSDTWLKEVWEEVLPQYGIELIAIDQELARAQAAGEKIDGQPYDSHWNKRGHEIAGGALLRALDDEPTAD